MMSSKDGGESVTQIKEGVLSAFNEAGVNSAIIPGLGNSFLSVSDPFEKLDTPKFYKEHFNYQVRYLMYI